MTKGKLALLLGVLAAVAAIIVPAASAHNNSYYYHSNGGGSCDTSYYHADGGPYSSYSACEAANEKSTSICDDGQTVTFTNLNSYALASEVWLYEWWHWSDTITAGACAGAAPAPEMSDSFVASGTYDGGMLSAFPNAESQQLIDGTYPGVTPDTTTGANVYRSPIATENADGSYTLHASLPSGDTLTGMAVGGDFATPGATTVPVAAVADSNALSAGSVDAGWYLIAG